MTPRDGDFVGDLKVVKLLRVWRTAALYEALGFAEIAVRPRYYRGGIDAVIMRLTVPAPETSLT